MLQQATMFNKGKSMLGMSSRTRRRAETRVDNNYDENQDWEDHQIYAGERLKVHSTKWQDPIVQEQLGLAI